MEGHDVDGTALRAARLERCPRQQAEAPGVVGELAGGVVVEAIAVEGRRMIDQAEAIPGGVEGADGELGRAGRGARVGHAQDEGRRRGVRGYGHRAVARQEHLDGFVEEAGNAAESTRQGVDDVTEAARLGPRLALGGDEDHAHAADGSPREERRRARACRSRRGAARQSVDRARRGIIPARMEPLVRVPTLPGAPFRLPPRFEGLRRLAYNLWWMWHPRAMLLFQRIDATTWSRYRNPIALFESSINWQPLLDDPSFIAEYEDVLGELDRYMENGSDHWFQRTHGGQLTGPIAYFCAEYGLHESLGIYSGGLGVLAGDHMKSASDMALPLVGVGLLYRKGYFRQSIDADGHQEHAYPDFDLARLPVLRVLDRMGDPLSVPVELPGRTVQIAVWMLQVGRVPVLLLDTDHAGNEQPDRPITHILYVRGREMRLHQELVLGVGGVRALRALDIAPAVWHLNEGHSAFLLVERAREMVGAGTPLADAWPAVKRASAFTIHTPVSAGNERFETGLVRRIAGPLFAGEGRPGTGSVPVDDVLALGRGVDDDPNQFDMTAFSLRLANGANAVSKLHGETANDTWQQLLGGRAIHGLTNGVHPPTWVGRPMRDLYQRFLDADLDDLDGQSDTGRFWERVGRIPDRELWEAHLHQKRQLAAFARGRLVAQLARHGESPATLAELGLAIDPEALTIGFARRFATYKRASLIFTDVARLARLVHDADRPVQLVFAGKAAPGRPARPAGRSSPSSSAAARPSCAAGSSSSRTTTCGSPSSWSAASTSG